MPIIWSPSLIVPFALIACAGSFVVLGHARRMARKNAAELARLEREHTALRAQSEADHRAMIHALRESEERTQMLMRNAPDAVFIVERDGRIAYVNDAVVELLGFSRAELQAMTVFDLVPADWREAYREVARTIVSSTERRVFEIRLVTRDGCRLPMELHVVVLPNGQVYGSCRDIREHKAAQKALKESREHLQRTVDSLAEGMYGVDTQGRCTFVNAAFLRILGFASTDEVLGRSIHSLIHHSHADGTPYPASECLMYQSFRCNQPSHTDQEVFWRKDGTAVPVEYWAQPLIQGDECVGAVATFLDITERKRLEEQLHDLAFYDVLTKLPNRRLLLDRLDRALISCARTRRHGALLFLDLDHFKSLNDLHGHDVGDQLLMEVAQRIRGCIRDRDSAARLGGDEFVVMLEDLSETLADAVIQVETVAEKIREALAQPYSLHRRRAGGDAEQIVHRSSSSIGVVVFSGHGESIEQLLQRADMAMYRAKSAGRNAIRFFDPAMQAAIETRAALEADLHLALEQRQLRLFYQMQVDDRGRPIGAEVLVRWRHPRRGLVSPAHFIPLAEETGLIVPIGAWALDTACAQLRCWRDRPSFSTLVLAVNVSARQFRQADFVAQVLSALHKHGIPPAALKLELTESLVLEDVEDTIAKMQALKTVGVGFSMDDFGTGYSSLSYLKRLPLDQIKIDQSFVRDITTDHGDTVMVATIIGLGLSFEMEVIAEGVETETQHAQLRCLGCAFFQGYLFGKPVPVEEFEAQVMARLPLVEA
ncbi:MAG: EAL domain-containing protein [Rhodocyclales bacterium]|nr:EAL domain-containing protein [Rhodocyclales bacterium]